MGHLTAPKTRHQITSIEVVSDDSLRVLRFSSDDSGGYSIAIRDATESEWSYKAFAYLDSDDAKVIAALLNGGDLLGYGAPKRIVEQLKTGAFHLDKPEAEKGPLDGDCTPLDIERAKAENLREERQNIELQMERDHALDKHLTTYVHGCPACDRVVVPSNTATDDDPPF